MLVLFLFRHQDVHQLLVHPNHHLAQILFVPDVIQDVTQAAPFVVHQAHTTIVAVQFVIVR